MGDAATTQRMTPAAYLEWERRQTGKHEYHLGEVFAMAGGSPRHNYLSNAAGAELRAALRGKLFDTRGSGSPSAPSAPNPCHVLSADQRIAAARGERYVYADAVAVCGGGTVTLANGARLPVDALYEGAFDLDAG